MCLLKAVMLARPGKMQWMGMMLLAAMMALAILRRRGALQQLPSRQRRLPQVCVKTAAPALTHMNTRRISSS
jgi:hypothetical protein